MWVTARVLAPLLVIWAASAAAALPESVVVTDAAATERGWVLAGFEDNQDDPLNPILIKVFASPDGQTITDISTELDDAAGTELPTAVRFVDAERGFLAAGTRIYRTEDRGGTWGAVEVGVAVTVLHFFDAERGVLGGLGGELRRTVDGGRTWMVVNSPTRADLHHLQFVDERHGVATAFGGDEGAVVLLTDDGGQSFRAVETGANRLGPPYFLAGGQTGFVPAWRGGQVGLLRTNDGGETFVEEPLPPVAEMGWFPISLSSLLGQRWEDEFRGWLVGTWALGERRFLVSLKTEDGGASWQVQGACAADARACLSHPGDGYLSGAVLRGPSQGFVLGDQGRFLPL